MLILLSNNLSLLRVIIVGLSKKLAAEHDELRLHRLLGAIFSPDLQMERKKEILASEYHIVMPNEMERSAEVMCNLSDAIEERGIEQGHYQTLFDLIKKGIISVSQAAEQAGVTITEFYAKIKELGITELIQ